MKVMKTRILFVLTVAFIFAQNVVVTAYPVVYLRVEDVPIQWIGIIVALCVGLSAILQPLSGRLIDRFPRLNWRNQGIFISLVIIALCIINIESPENSWPEVFTFYFFLILSPILSSFVSTATFQYCESGVNINFGMIRGTGAAAFGVFSFLLGHIVAETSPRAIFFYILVTSIVMLIFIMLIQPPKFHAAEKKSKTERPSLRDFIRRHPVFVLMIISLTMFFFQHTIIETYFINIIELKGGTQHDLGNLGSLAAIIELGPMFLFSRMMKKISVYKLYYIGAIGYVLRAFTYFLAPDMTILYVAHCMQLFSFAFIAPACSYISDAEMAEDEKAFGQAITAGTNFIGICLSGIVGGQLIFLFNVEAIMIAGIVASLLGFFFATLMLYKKSQVK